MNFVHLRVRTEYSLMESLLRVNDIASFCDKNKFLACGLMDFQNLSAGLQFSSKIVSKKVKPLIGMSLNIHSSEKNYNREIGLIAKNENGYKNLLKILFKINSNEEKKIDLKTLAENSKDLICITGGFYGILKQDFNSGSQEIAEGTLDQLLEIFKEDLYIELNRHGLQNEKIVEDFLVNLAYKKSVPLVATNDVRFLIEDQYEAFDALICIKNKTFIIEDDRERLNNHFYFKTEKEMIDLFSDIPEAIQNTIEIAKKCSFYIKERKPILPSFSTENITESDLLRQKTKIGLEEKLKLINKINKNDTEPYWNRLEYELGIISKMNFDGYFLMVSDFINWAKSNGIAVGPGRGSGAGSIIAWALNITNIDPLQYKLLFERFLNPDRISLPDFDIDFCQERRHEVIEYVKNKYGSDRVSNIATYGKLNAKAAIKDVGRVLHIPYGKLDDISKMIPFNPLEPITIEKAMVLDPRLQFEKENDMEIQQLIEIAIDVEGLNRHSSIHAAGIIISNEKLVDVAPVDFDFDTKMPVLAYDMKDAEKIGLVKFDFLGLKTLTVISQIINLLKKKNIIVDIDNVDIHDEKTFELLRSGNLKGIFQFEAAIPRNTLKKIKTNHIEDLIAVTSLARPGPMDNLPLYIRRKTGEEKTEYYHESLKDVLQDTFGIMIYQEQVMQVVQILGGYSLGEADIVRRAMGKKIKEEMDQQREIFIKKAVEKGIINKDEANNIFDIIAKFAGYGFNRSHAAAYAFISYQTAFLKANYPLEFIIANLNLEIQDTDKMNFFILDAKVFGVEILPPDVNKSDVYFKEENGKIRYALTALKATGQKSTEQICEIRKNGGPFKSLIDMLERLDGVLNKKNLEALILSGAIDQFEYTRMTLMENIQVLLDYKKPKTNDSLFSSEELSTLPLKTFEEYDYLRKLQLEFDVFGFYFSKHPMEDKKKDLIKSGMVLSNEIEELFHNKTENSFFTGGVIIKIVQRFKKNKRFAFVHLVDFEGIFEVMIFDDKLIDIHREKLEEGKSIVMKVDGKKNEETGIRLLIKEIYTVDEFLLLRPLHKKGETLETVSEYQIEDEDKMLTLNVDKNFDIIALKQGIENGAYKEYKMIKLIFDDSVSVIKLKD